MKKTEIYAVFKVQEDGDKNGCVGSCFYTQESRTMIEHTKSHQESETLVDESGL